jgi:uncharacterized membrane protein
MDRSMDDKLIKKWVREELVSQEQADRMLADLRESRRESRSGKFVTAVSTVGAVLLGVGAILFIASNWRELSSIVKMALLLGATAAAYASGYYLKYEFRELPRIGGALMFLGALLFGATVMLTAQIYHVNANDHALVLIWLIGILPLVFAMRTYPTAILGAALLMLWVGLFATSRSRFFGIDNLPYWYVVSGLALFGIGGLLYLGDGLEKVARAWRLVALKVSMFSLFLLTFRWLVEHGRTAFMDNGYELTRVLVIAVLAILAIGLDSLLRKEESPRLESYTGIGIAAFMMLFLLYPLPTIAYVIVFNLLFAALTLLFIWSGYARGDIRIVNMGVFWLAAFLIARYFDWFWGLLDRALFFLVGGLILVIGGIVLEKQRRHIKSSFGE